MLVGGQPVGIVGVVGFHEAEQAAGLFREHLLAEPRVVVRCVAEDVDRPDLGKVAFIDLEHDIDAVLIELDDLRLDPSRESPLAAVKFENPVDVRTRR